MLMLWNIFGESSGAPEPAPVDHLLNCCRFPGEKVNHMFFAASSSTKRYMVDDLSNSRSKEMRELLVDKLS